MEIRISMYITLRIATENVPMYFIQTFCLPRIDKFNES